VLLLVPTTDSVLLAAMRADRSIENLHFLFAQELEIISKKPPSVF